MSPTLSGCPRRITCQARCGLRWRTLWWKSRTSAPVGDHLHVHAFTWQGMLSVHRVSDWNFDFRCIFTFEISDYVFSLHQCYLGIDLSDGVWSHQPSRDQTRQVGGWASPAGCWRTKRGRRTWSTLMKRGTNSAWCLQAVWKDNLWELVYLMLYLNENIFLSFREDFEFFQGYCTRSHNISFGK